MQTCRLAKLHRCVGTDPRLDRTMRAVQGDDLGGSQILDRADPPAIGGAIVQFHMLWPYPQLQGAARPLDHIRNRNLGVPKADMRAALIHHPIKPQQIHRG